MLSSVSTQPRGALNDTIKGRMTAATKKKPPKPKKPEGRKKSKLTLIGDESMRLALLEACVANDWNLTKVAAEFDMAAAGNVLRSIRQFGLEKQYKAARIKRINEA